jgi:uncharacterized protein (TIGR03118 family)
LEEINVKTITYLITAAMLVAGAASAQHYQQTNLVSNVTGAAAKTDPNLVNGWGLSRSSSSPWWVSDNGTGKATLYDGSGNPQSLVVTVPGAPTGTVFNGDTAHFQITPGNAARFLFASEDGTISAWNPAVDPSAMVVVTTPGAVYKGLAIATPDGGSPQLYATDFHNGHIDVFDTHFNRLPRGGDAFTFDGHPRGLSPFGIQNIGGNLFVTFAKPDAARHDDVHGPGLGMVAVFSPRGRLLNMFEHVQALNAPWGLALAPSDFGAFSHHLLVGQFGSGEIVAYNIETGKFAGELLDPAGQTLAIQGIWGIGFGNGKTAGPATTLFFAAGPDDEQNGLFGSLVPVAADLVQGNGK